MKKKNTVIIILLISFIIIQNVKAAGVLDNLITDGKYIMNSVPPKDEYEACELFHKYDYGIKGGLLDCSRSLEPFDYAVFEYHYGREDEEEQTVNVIYNYDLNIKAKVENYSNIIMNKQYIITDAEFINWVLYGMEKVEYENDHSYNYYHNTIAFSEELKNDLNYNNIYFQHEDYESRNVNNIIEDLSNYCILILYNNTVYKIEMDQDFNYKTYAKVIRVVYVPNETIDENILNTVQLRFDSIREGAIITEEGTINDWKQLNTNYNYNSTEYDEYLNQAVDKYYKVKYGDIEQSFIVIKDSSKIKNISFKTKDLETDIAITTSSKKIANDAKVNVKKIDSGSEYNQIKSKIDYSEGNIYDIRLQSPSQNEAISTISDSVFKIKVPLSDNIKDKDIKAYYINQNGEIEEYDVVKDENSEFVEFETSHLSVYALGIKKETSGPTAGDNVAVYIIIFLAVLSSVIGVSIYNKKKESK